MFLFSLGLTLIFELPLCWFWGLKSRKQLFLAFLVNLLTNPAAVALHWFGVPQIPIEIIVLLTEFMVYRSFERHPDYSIRHPFALSLSANGISYGLGILIQLI
jgi:hypothetical protein